MNNQKYSVHLSWNEHEWKYIAFSDDYPALTGFGITRAKALDNLEVQIQHILDK